MNPPPEDKSYDRIESALRGLQLRKPSDMLDQRVSQTMRRRVIPWRSVAAAACFGGLCFWFGLMFGQQADVTGPALPQGGEAKNPAPSDQATSGPRLVSGPTRFDAQWPVAQAQYSYNIDTGPPVQATVRDAIERTRWVDTENNRDIELIRPVREVSLTRQNLN